MTPADPLEEFLELIAGLPDELRIQAMLRLVAEVLRTKDIEAVRQIRARHAAMFPDQHPVHTDFIDLLDGHLALREIQGGPR